MDWRENAKLTMKVAAVTGERFCRRCCQYRKVEGGTTTIARQGNRIWRCRQCSAGKNPGGFK